METTTLEAPERRGRSRKSSLVSSSVRSWTRCFAVLGALSVLSGFVTACTPDGGGTAESSPCRTPADVSFVEYAETSSRPPWAAGWVESSLSATATVASENRAASDEELLGLALSCAGLTGLSWDDYTSADRKQQPFDVVVGVQHYLYQAANVATEEGRFVIAVVVHRTDDSSAKFAVQAMPVQGDVSVVAPDGAGVVQSLRNAGLF